jgi:hypothetical protein
VSLRGSRAAVVSLLALWSVAIDYVPTFYKNTVVAYDLKQPAATAY